jgi:hypothetical protein
VAWRGVERRTVVVDFTGQQRGEHLASSSSVLRPIVPDFRFLSLFYNSWSWGAEALGIKGDRRHGAGPAACTHAYAQRRRAGSERKQSRMFRRAVSAAPLPSHRVSRRVDRWWLWRGAAAAAFSARLQASRPPRVAHVPAATLDLRLAHGAPAPGTPTDPSVTPLVTSRSVFTEQQRDVNRLL